MMQVAVLRRLAPDHWHVTVYDAGSIATPPRWIAKEDHGGPIASDTNQVITQRMNCSEIVAAWKTPEF